MVVAKSKDKPSINDYEDIMKKLNNKETEEK